MLFSESRDPSSCAISPGISLASGFRVFAVIVTRTSREESLFDSSMSSFAMFSEQLRLF